MGEGKRKTGKYLGNREEEKRERRSRWTVGRGVMKESEQRTRGKYGKDCA